MLPGKAGFFCIPHLLHLLNQLPGGLCQLLPVLIPALVQGPQQIQKSNPAVGALPGKISSCIKRLSIRRQKQTGRPSAASGKQHTGRHVNAVNIRPLFSVYFHRNKMTVQLFSHLFILKILMGHHMAPVAGAVADA